MIELTAPAKINGVLTKHIHRNEHGDLISDGSACVMSRGYAPRVRLNDLAELGALIDDLPEHVDIATHPMSALYLLPRAHLDPAGAA